MTRDTLLNEVAESFGFDVAAPIKIGGNYVPLVRHGDAVHVSGQIPRIGDKVVVTGAVGSEVSLAQARIAASVCVIRALALLRDELGSLDAVARILRISVFVQSAPTFTQQSEVADAASDLLVRVLGPAGQHARTSVGVVQLPKSASVEVELSAALFAG